MNPVHLELCASPGWAEAVEQQILPWVLEGLDLGDDVIEVGPGPGLTTNVLRTLVARLTAVEIDPDLADALAERLADTNVTVVNEDATHLPFDDDSFSGAVSCTMLHHVPSVALQDQLLAELARVLRPGGQLAGVDSLDSDGFRDLHVDDTCVPLVPSELAGRLEAAGFTAVEVITNEYGVRFRAQAAS